MKLRLFSAADIATALPMRQCVEVMKQAFADFSSGRAQVPQRTVLPIEDRGTLLVKPAFAAGSGLGAKLVSVFPGNAKVGQPVTPGVVVMLSPTTGQPLALLDGTFLTAWRAGAASGAATDLLAAPEAQLAAVFGAGGQARTQVLAIDAVRRFKEIRIYARNRGGVGTFIEELQPQVQAQLLPSNSPAAAIDGAQVVCAATTSTVPVFSGRELTAGAHVNGVGSFKPEMQEVDFDTVRRARSFVDSIESAQLEPGDLVQAVEAGITLAEDWTELGTIAEAPSPPHAGDRDVTFFKSVGLAIQDIAAGAAVLERADVLDLGRTVEF